MGGKQVDELAQAPEGLENPEVYQFQRMAAHLILNSRCIHPKPSLLLLSLARPFQLQTQFVVEYDQEMDKVVTGGTEPLMFLSIYGFDEKSDPEGSGEKQFLEVWQIKAISMRQAKQSETHGVKKVAAMMRCLATHLRQLPVFDFYKKKKLDDRLKGKTTFRVSTKDPGWGVGAGRQSNIKTKNFGEVETDKGRFSLEVRYRAEVPQDFFALREPKSSLDGNIVPNHFEKAENRKEKATAQVPIAITRLPVCGGSHDAPPYNPFSLSGASPSSSLGPGALMDCFEDTTDISCRAAWEPGWWEGTLRGQNAVENISFTQQSCSVGSAGSVGSEYAFKDMMVEMELSLDIDYSATTLVPPGHSPEKADELEI